MNADFQLSEDEDYDESDDCLLSEDEDYGDSPLSEDECEEVIQVSTVHGHEQLNQDNYPRRDPPKRRKKRRKRIRRELQSALQIFNLNHMPKTDQPWIQQHIPYKVCKKYVKDPKSKVEDTDAGRKYIERCCCGAEEYEHETGSFSKNPDDTVWSKENDIRIAYSNDEKGSGGCFGKIKFVEEDGTHQPDFVRVSDDMLKRKSGARKVMELLESKWRLPRPNLIISVTGGAGDFHCPPELEKRFMRGLAKAAKSTNAWIFSGGTNTGVMKLVGEAVRGTSFGSQIVTIGIATWGIVKNREQLTGLDRQNNRRRPIRDYKTKSDRMRRGAFLDANHTHFLLVDDGTQYQFGREITFRALLEQIISERYREGQFNLPQICILMEGGPNSMQTLVETIRLGNCCLVIAGSGRCADVIAEAYKLSTTEEAFNESGEPMKIRVLSDNASDEVMNIISKKNPRLSSEEKEKFFLQILELFKHDQLLNIYELNDSREFDLQILSALIRGNKEGSSSIASMKLAITWDRPNLAQSMILPSANFSEQEKYDLLRIAINNDKHVFIQMMLDQGVDLKHFLTHSMLASLYNEIDSSVVCFKKLQKLCYAGDSPQKVGKVTLTLVHIGRLLEEILEGTFQSMFNSREYICHQDDYKNRPFENPYDVMVFFAVFVESREMAKLFWSRSRTPIATGLIACKILRYLAETQRTSSKRDEENEKDLLECADEFETLATGVMNRVYKDRNNQKELWEEVLTIKHKHMGNLDLLQLASSTSAIKFIAQGAVQTKLTDMWLGQLHAAQHWSRIMLAGLIPILGPIFIARYEMIKSDPETENKTSADGRQGTEMSLNEMENGKEVGGEVETDGANEYPAEFTHKRKLRNLEKLYCFYRAPLVKFQYYVIMYLAFIFTFAYTLVLALPNARDEYAQGKTTWTVGRYSSPEIFLLLYVISTIPIEIQQIWDQVPKTTRMKLFIYFSDLFNVLDILGIVSFIGGFIIKSQGSPDFVIPTNGHPDYTNAYHLLMILSFLMYCVRLIQMFRMNSKMGPKIIMIGKMMIDLFFFIFLMAIFLLSYGVCAQALMNPNQGLNDPDSTKTNGTIIWDVVFRPYLHVFGELDLDGMYAELEQGHCTGVTDCDITSIVHDSTGQIHYYLVLLLMFMYLLFVNILLINLLIAIFSKSYEDIQADSDILWKVQRSEMIHEYKDYPVVPQPLSVVYHLCTFLLFLGRKCLGCCNNEEIEDEEYESKAYRVSMIEAESREDYQNKKEDEEEMTNSAAYRGLKSELDAIKALVRQSAITTSSTPSPPGKQTPQPNPATDTTKLTKIKPLRVHVDSRTSPYPGSSVDRFSLSDDKVSWLVRYRGYKPVQYTAPEIANQTGDLVDTEEITNIKFNKVNCTMVEGKRWTIDRTSYHGEYNLVNGFPQNPKGRTGVVGRGCLARWGPNKAADTVVTRWHRDAQGEIVKMEGLPVLEFVAIYRPNFSQWAIPGGRVKPNERVFETIKREFSEEALSNLSRPPPEQQHISEMMAEHFRLGITVYKGYVDDPRNTDNAWIETIAVNYHDSTGKSFSNFPLKRGDESGSGVQWKPIDQNLDLFANHEWIIEKVCYHRDAYNPIKEPKRRNTQVWMTQT